MATLDTKDADRIARKYAKDQGWAGSKGGWIAMEDGKGAVICQGWGSFYLRFKSQIHNWLAVQLTGGTFDALVNASDNYCPTIRAEGKRAADLRALADAFDSEMERRGSTRRAYRGVGYERYVTVRAQVWYGGWTIRDTATGADLDYHNASEDVARKEAALCNWRRAHGYRIGYGAEAISA